MLYWLERYFENWLYCGYIIVGFNYDRHEQKNINKHITLNYMSIPSKYSGKYFFHFTHIDNLDSIVKHGILCTNKKKELEINHLNLASETIQERRSSMKVTCLPKGKVHDYVPFYFCSMNPMVLSLINSKNVDQQFIIFFAIPIEKLLDANVIFTDASANTDIPPNFYNDPNDLDKLDWTAIQSKKWGHRDKDELHRRMAEVLIKDSVSMDMVSHIVVWNEGIKEYVEKTFKTNKVKSPNITYQPLSSTYYFHFTKFMIGQGNSSLITGPYFLKLKYENAIKTILEKRAEMNSNSEFLFDNIEDAITKIDSNFCLIPEMDGIFELETKNEIHSENVSDHTLKVVEKLEAIEYYQNAKPKDKNILKLAAYLHDIGKGPKSRWSDGVQPAYPDHPADAPKMLERILAEDFKDISEYEIKKVCILVTYHDLIGEIIGKGRDNQQLVDIVKNEKTFDMLATLNLADVSAINRLWRTEYIRKLENIKNEVFEKLKND